MALPGIKRLLVEGEDDKFAIVGLMEHHTVWPDNRDDAPVNISAIGSVSQILNAHTIPAQMKAAGLDTIGVIIDADDDPPARWARFRSICLGAFPGIPITLPKNGLILENDRGLRLGFWLMPDCSSTGMLETFLQHLVPEASEALWQHAGTAFDAARGLGASCRDVHADKARIHTWLAWQDPPGDSPGRALTKRTLDPAAVAASAFVGWFKELYRL